MGKNMRKILFMCIILMAIFTVNSYTAEAKTQEFVVSDGKFEAIVIENKAYIISCKLTGATQITVPAKIKGYKVVSVGYSTELGINHLVFDQCSKVKKIIISEGISEIAASAFQDLNTLKEIKMPSTLKSIGDYAVAGTSISTVNIPDSVVEIGVGTFTDTPLYAKYDVRKPIYIDKCLVYVPQTVSGTFVVKEGTQTIGGYAFNFTKPQKVVLPESLKGISDVAFWNFCSMSEINISKNVEYIGNSAFGTCSNLQKFDVNEENKYFADYEGSLYTKDLKKLVRAKHDVSIEVFELPLFCQEIGEFSFASTSYTEVKLNDNIKEIPKSAFRQASIQEFEFPKNVERIGVAAFDGCRNLKEIKLSEKVKVIDRLAFSSSVLKEIKLPDSVEIIGRQCFANSQELETIKMSSNIKEIGLEVLYNTPIYNNSANWKEGILYYANCIFETRSDELKKNVEIKHGTRVIADGAFSFSEIKSITLPNNVVGIDQDTFAGCDENLKIFYTVGNYKYIISGSSTVAFAGIENNKVTKVVVPKTVKICNKTFKVASIADRALYKKTKVTSVTVGTNVKNIGSSALEGCTKLSKVILGSNVTEIGDKAFKGCKVLKSIIIPGKVKTIGKEIFRNCSKLGVITIKTIKLKTVGENAFKNIKSTAKIEVPTTKVSTYRKLLKGKGQKSTVKIINKK